MSDREQQHEQQHEQRLALPESATQLSTVTQALRKLLAPETKPQKKSKIRTEQLQKNVVLLYQLLELDSADALHNMSRLELQQLHNYILEFLQEVVTGYSSETSVEYFNSQFGKLSGFADILQKLVSFEARLFSQLHESELTNFSLVALKESIMQRRLNAGHSDVTPDLIDDVAAYIATQEHSQLVQIQTYVSLLRNVCDLSEVQGSHIEPKVVTALVQELITWLKDLQVAGAESELTEDGVLVFTQGELAETRSFQDLESGFKKIETYLQKK